MQKLLQLLDKNTQNKVAMRTTNEIGRRARVESRRLLSRTYNLKLKDIPIDIIKATPYRLSVFIKASARRISLMKFKPKKTKSGIQVQVKKGENKSLPNAFIAQPIGKDWKKYGQRRSITTSSPYVFVRKSGKSYPLKALKAFSIWQMLRTKWVKNHIDELIKTEGNNIFQKEIERAVIRFIQK